MTERRIFTPPEYIESDTSVIFLAGPIQGAPNWQLIAIDIIHGINPQIIIASPRRISWEGADYNEQVDWETAHLKMAGRNGAIVFWLAKEEEHLPNRAYAQTSRAELFEWKVKHESDGVKLVIGIEDGFSGAKYIRKRFSEDCPNVPILDNLEDTCKKALEVLE